MGRSSTVAASTSWMRASGRDLCRDAILAHTGLLDDHRHTSNGNGFISKHVPKYRAHELYQKLRAVRDGNVITANGLAPFAFAAEIFRTVAPDRADDIAKYEGLYSRGLLDDKNCRQYPGSPMMAASRWLVGNPSFVQIMDGLPVIHSRIA